MARASKMPTPAPRRSSERWPGSGTAGGDRISAIEVNTLVQAVLISDHPLDMAKPLAKEYGMEAEHVLESPLLLIGSVDQIAETLERRRERFGLSYITVFEKDLESLAKVIAPLRRRGVSGA